VTDVRRRDPCCGNPVPLLVIGIVFAALALAACSPAANEPGPAPNAPHQDANPRDPSGMH
jgi:hypothetical protein